MRKRPARRAWPLCLRRTFGLRMRRIATAAFLFAIVAAIAWWLLSLRQSPAQLADPWAAVPADAVAVLEVPNPVAAWDHFTGTSQFWGSMEGNPGCAAVDSIVRRIARSANFQNQAKGSSLLIAWSMPEGNRPVPLIAWPLEPSAEALQVLGRAFGKPMAAGLWNGEPQSLPADRAMPALELAWGKGLLLIGTAKPSVEAALAATARAGRSDPYAKARASFSMGADAHLLVQAGFAAQWLQAGDQPLFPGGPAMEGWLALDVRLRPDALLMNGLLLPADRGAALAAMASQQPAKPEVMRVLPASVAWMNWARVDSPAAFIRNSAGGQMDEALFTAYGAWMRGIGRARQAGGDGGSWAVLQANNPADAAGAMALRCPDNGCPATEYRGVRITRLADPQALATLFGKPYAAFQQPLWALLDDMVVFADTPAAMRAAIDAWTDRNSLALAPGRGDFFTRFGSQAVYTWWADVPQTWPPDSDGAMAAIQRTLGPAMLQISPRSDGAFIATFCVQQAPTGNKTDGALWTAAMPAPLAMPPVLVDDYLSKTQQVLVQDRDHRVSLISCTGKVLWQRQLDGPLLGGVQQIDRFRNAKLQLLCNTAGKIYLIDRLGRDVEGFPVTLKADASAPLSVFDYEGNKDYRILLPLVNGTVANLAPDGKPVQGWEPEKLPAPALAPVEHVRNKNKDFLVIPLRNGSVAVLDRRGAVRYSPALRMRGLQRFLGSRDAMDIGDRSLLWADSAGAVLCGTLNGHVDTLSQPASGTVSLYAMDGGPASGILRTTASALTGQAAGKLLFSISFPDSPGATAFGVPLADGRNAIGLALPEQDQLRLYDETGTLWPGFPLKGAVPFTIADINRDGLPELVTADAQGVVTVYVLPTKP